MVVSVSSCRGGEGRVCSRRFIRPSSLSLLLYSAEGKTTNFRIPLFEPGQKKIERATDIPPTPWALCLKHARGQPRMEPVPQSEQPVVGDVPAAAAPAEEEAAPVKGYTMRTYLRMPRAEFMAKMRQLFPFQIEGVDRRLDEHLKEWSRRKTLIPGQSEGDSLYLAWVLNRVPSLDRAQKNSLLDALRVPPFPLTQNILDVLSVVSHYRAGQRDLAAALNGEDTYTEEALAELMQADHDRLHDFIRTWARMKANQVDMSDETWLDGPEEVKAAILARRRLHIKSYEAAVNHPWLDETADRGKGKKRAERTRDGKGVQRTRGEKEIIVTGLLNTGPQPRTIEDERWRQADKKQCLRDAIDTTVTQSGLIRGEWSGHPLEWVLDRSGGGEPNRFGRTEENKRVYARPPYVKEIFHRVSPFAVWDPPLQTIPATTEASPPPPPPAVI
jgi:hypothetical protein